nr:cytidylate kinase family protein [uncultured Desulfobulbus sp.]
MKNDKLIQRTLLFIYGLFIMAIGVDLSVKANLGVSPISSVPYVYCLTFPLTLGQTTIAFNILLIILQILVLQKAYQWIQLIQIPVVFLFGWFIDMTLPMVAWIEPENYLSQTFYCLLGCVVLALGVYFEVKAKLTYLPGEGLAMALNKRFGFEFGKTKIAVDSSMVIAGIISSLIFLGDVQGIREGTVAAAILVGYCVRFFNQTISLPRSWIAMDPVDETASATVVDRKAGQCIITISRELGSGGHAVGKLVAEKLGISFYDEQLIELTAEQSGFTAKYIEENEQQLANSLFYTLYEQNYAYVDSVMPPPDALFMVQSKIIRDIATKESCVIVGRCADFVLMDSPCLLKVFVHANETDREQQIIQRYAVPQEEAKELLAASDRKRANYCQRFTGKTWGKADNYMLSFDSTSLGIDYVVDMIVQTIQYQQTNREDK